MNIWRSIISHLDLPSVDSLSLTCHHLWNFISERTLRDLYHCREGVSSLRSSALGLFVYVSRGPSSLSMLGSGILRVSDNKKPEVHHRPERCWKPSLRSVGNIQQRHVVKLDGSRTVFKAGQGISPRLELTPPGHRHAKRVQHTLQHECRLRWRCREQGAYREAISARFVYAAQYVKPLPPAPPSFAPS